MIRLLSKAKRSMMIENRPVSWFSVQKRRPNQNNKKTFPRRQGKQFNNRRPNTRRPNAFFRTDRSAITVMGESERKEAVAAFKDCTFFNFLASNKTKTKKDVEKIDRSNSLHTTFMEMINKQELNPAMRKFRQSMNLLDRNGKFIGNNIIFMIKSWNLNNRLGEKNMLTFANIKYILGNSELEKLFGTLLTPNYFKDNELNLSVKMANEIIQRVLKGEGINFLPLLIFFKDFNSSNKIDITNEFLDFMTISINHPQSDLLQCLHSARKFVDKSTVENMSKRYFKKFLQNLTLVHKESKDPHALISSFNKLIDSLDVNNQNAVFNFIFQAFDSSVDYSSGIKAMVLSIILINRIINNSVYFTDIADQMPIVGNNIILSNKKHIEKLALNLTTNTKVIQALKKTNFTIYKRGTNQRVIRSQDYFSKTLRNFGSCQVQYITETDPTFIVYFTKSTPTEKKEANLSLWETMNLDMDEQTKLKLFQERVKPISTNEGPYEPPFSLEKDLSRMQKNIFLYKKFQQNNRRNKIMFHKRNMRRNFSWQVNKRQFSDLLDDDKLDDMLMMNFEDNIFDDDDDDTGLIFAEDEDIIEEYESLDKGSKEEVDEIYKQLDLITKTESDPENIYLLVEQLLEKKEELIQHIFTSYLNDREIKGNFVGSLSLMHLLFHFQPSSIAQSLEKHSSLSINGNNSPFESTDYSKYLNNNFLKGDLKQYLYIHLFGIQETNMFKKKQFKRLIAHYALYSQNLDEGIFLKVVNICENHKLTKELLEFTLLMQMNKKVVSVHQMSIIISEMGRYKNYSNTIFSAISAYCRLSSSFVNYTLLKNYFEILLKTNKLVEAMLTFDRMRNMITDSVYMFDQNLTKNENNNKSKKYATDRDEAQISFFNAYFDHLLKNNFLNESRYLFGFILKNEWLKSESQYINGFKICQEEPEEFAAVYESLINNKEIVIKANFISQILLIVNENIALLAEEFIRVLEGFIYTRKVSLNDYLISTVLILFSNYTQVEEIKIFVQFVIEDQGFKVTGKVRFNMHNLFRTIPNQNERNELYAYINNKQASPIAKKTSTKSSQERFKKMVADPNSEESVTPVKQIFTSKKLKQLRSGYEGKNGLNDMINDFYLKDREPDEKIKVTESLKF